MSICLLLIWIVLVASALGRFLKPQQTTAWKGKHATTHPPLRVCGHKIEAWDPRHDKNPRNEGPNGNAPNEDAPNDVTDGNTPNEDARNEDATYGNAPNSNATAPNKYPRYHIRRGGCGTCIRSSPPARMNTNGVPTQTGTQDYIRAQGHRPCARLCTPPPLWQILNSIPREPLTTNPPNENRKRRPRAKPTNEPPANENWERPPRTMTAGRTHPNRRSTSGSTQPQYPTPATAGVGYYKRKKSSVRCSFCVAFIFN
ncbi:hypothetical protein BS47DRAFT_1367816 [Hydnum rufescens UP504]|uniref:Secreted protein n=1 Tax=Hydnum rufescens UP504 TaxID=1448309 RepID=A0A9P6DP07_9AGAM|nr:hypothetical protein BS47DRAFT_1367816 [Hydnum rufescens UP504]